MVIIARQGSHHIIRCYDRMTRIPFGVPFMTQLGLLGGRGLAVGSGRARRDAVYVQARPGAANFRVVGPREFAAAHASGYLPQLGVRAPDGAVREPVTFAANLEGPAAIESGVTLVPFTSFEN